ncbi:MAG: DUF2283 domain-containing protein [Chloroflexi bacterium]|nr:DUF2283 domain-containing protein [Chloroflexota bacterium]
MAENRVFQYDREADILHIDTVTPYAAQESEELGDEIIARLNPKTGGIENLEVLFFKPAVEKGTFLHPGDRGNETSGANVSFLPGLFAPCS